MISVVITNFNGLTLLKKNLPKILSLLDRSKLDYELIISDDASVDESVKFIEELQSTNSRLQLIKKNKNEGFASTVDAGIKGSKGEFVFTLKTDSVPESSDYFTILLSHFKNNPELFAVSSCLKTIENGKEELRGCGQIYFEKGFFLHKRKESKISTISSWADGSASVFNKKIYEKLGGFDSVFNPFYWEDVDLGYRAWKSGYTIEFDPQAVLLHEHEKGAILSHYSASEIKKIALRNQFIFVWKNADLNHLFQFFTWETYHHIIALKNRQFEWIKVYWQAFIKWPQILARRFSLKRIIKLSDNEALAIF